MQTYDEKTTAEIRWKIASDFADYLPHVYGEEFRRISAGKCDAKIKEAELRIWKEAGKKEKKYAVNLNLPLDSAIDVAKAYDFISGAMIGPEMKGEIKEEIGDIAKVVITSCPMLKASLEIGGDLRINSEMCSAFSKSAIENLNPAYRFVGQKSMCNGDPVCEALVVKK